MVEETLTFLSVGFLETCMETQPGRFSSRKGWAGCQLGGLDLPALSHAQASRELLALF